METLFMVGVAVGWAVLAAALLRWLVRRLKRARGFTWPPETPPTPPARSQAIRLVGERRALPDVDRRRLVLIAGPHKSAEQRAMDRWINEQELTPYIPHRHLVAQQDETRSKRRTGA